MSVKKNDRMVCRGPYSKMNFVILNMFFRENLFEKYMLYILPPRELHEKGANIKKSVGDSSSGKAASFVAQNSTEA